MSFEPRETIRTRKDGSIDTAFYMARGRKQRSEAAIAMLHRPERRAHRKPASGLFSFLF